MGRCANRGDISNDNRVVVDEKLNRIRANWNFESYFELLGFAGSQKRFCL
jgi:hypothetical protein